MEKGQKKNSRTKNGNERKGIESNKMSMVEEESYWSSNIDEWCHQQKGSLLDWRQQERLEFLI